MLIRPAGQPLPSAPANLEIRQVTDRRTLTDFKRVLVDGFPLDELQPFRPDAWLDECISNRPATSCTLSTPTAPRSPAAGW